MNDIARGPTRPASPFIAPPAATYVAVEREVAGVALDHPGWKRWWLALAGGMGLLGLFALCLGFLFWKGVGVWGNNIPVTWALDIVGYDWWMGVACGGLLTSALFLLLGAEWRGALNRITETMALLAACAGAVYPIIHLGRPWFFYWNLPYPNTLALWPQFRSPLYWDAVDIISFLVVAISFWYIGMLPDLASLRDRAFGRALAAGGRGMLRAQTYGVLALGWRGSASHWQRWTQAYRTIGLLGVLVVVALQTGAAVMFAGTLEPGWHDTLEPVSFLCAALLAGVAVVAVLTVLMRAVFELQPLITSRHLDVLARLLLGLAWLNIYCYVWDFFMTGLTGDSFEVAAMSRRVGGAHGWAWWAIVGCALLPVQLFFVPSLRRSPGTLLGIGALVAFGMWADHFMVIVATLQEDFLPSSFHAYAIEAWGAATFVGTCGLFLVLLLLFLRYMPTVSILEMRRLARTGAATSVRAGAWHGSAERSARRRRALGRGSTEASPPLWGISAEFTTPEALVAAIIALRDHGFRPLQAYSPVPVPGAAKALRLHSEPIRPFALGGVLLGGVLMMGMCTWATVDDYVFNIGGRPLFSWPYFVIPSVSFAMLVGTLAVLLALLVLNRLPRLNHPAFNIPNFERSTQDRFFLVVEARDDNFDPDATEQALAALPSRPVAVSRVPR